MKLKLFKCALMLCLLSVGSERGFSQAFTNLNFESASIPAGTQPGASLPISAALPGWAASFSNATGVTDAVTQVFYNTVSLGGEAIVLNQFSPTFPGGRFNVSLFGGEDPSSGNGGSIYFSATISQAGMVPDGTESLRVQVGPFAGVPLVPIIIMLGGETINMVPLANGPTYTLYGGDVSGFAGHVETLSITEPPSTLVPPSIAVIDNIVFSTLPTPEPGTVALMAAGAGLFGLRRWRKGLP